MSLLSRQRFHVSLRFFGRSRIERVAWALAVTSIFIVTTVAPSYGAQTPEPGSSASLGSLQGSVRDSRGQPVANATVSLSPSLLPEAAGGISALPTQTVNSDAEGAYRFAALPAGVYSLRAKVGGADEAVVGPVTLAAKETKQIDLVLHAPKVDAGQNASSAPLAAQANSNPPAFYDEPQFTVAGVTDATNPGGYGSDVVLRASEALTRATLSLSKDSSSSADLAASAATESSVRDAVAHNPKDPKLHHQLGAIEEKLGNPLEAVREYQRAAELDASEANLFDWGSELLTHGALEPATEVFTRGSRLFPNSVRMLVALGVSWYARGSYEQATECLIKASDLAPENPTPYIFLGKMEGVETNATERSAEILARFARLQPENALANYYYAVSLAKQEETAGGAEHTSESGTNREIERSGRVEALLRKAVLLDPKLGAAYSQLGTLYSRRGDFSAAISAYRKAIEVGAEDSENDGVVAEAHYRLAQAYFRMGEKEQAQEQLQLHSQWIEKTKEDTKRKVRESHEFVISIREKSPSPTPQN